MTKETHISRSYRYRIYLTDSQESALKKQETALRLAWNRMVNWQRCSLRDWEHGRQKSLLAECRKIIDGKKMTGVAASKALERATKDNITAAAALAKNRSDAVAKMQKFGPRRIGVVLAQERLMSKAANFYGGQKCLLYGLVQKFQKSCENWLKLAGTAQAPRYKRDQDSVAVQFQVTATSRVTLGRETDLSRILGQCGKRVDCVWHRPLPADATVKQLAVAGTIGRRYLIVFFSAPGENMLKPFAPASDYVGIDTGYCMALTARDNSGFHQEFQPPLYRDERWLDNLGKLQRKSDRQRRAANPHAFNANGTWKRKQKATNLSAKGLATLHKIRRMNEKLANVRREFYHVTSFRLLQKYKHIALGSWRPKANDREGQSATARKNQNRKGLDHAICMFESILTDKVRLSASERHINVVSEPYTTQTCYCCKALTGPKGWTGIISWTCSQCGAVNHRKGNNADNIRHTGGAALIEEVRQLPKDLQPVP